MWYTSHMIAWFDASQITVLHHTLPTQGPLAIAGIVVGHLAFSDRLRRDGQMTALRADLLAFSAVAAAVIVGHLFALMTTQSDAPLWQVAAPQSSLGALAGGALALLWPARRWRMNLLVVLDAALWAFVHGWPLVRLGCALVHDHPGRRSTAALALRFADGPRLDIGLLEWLLALGVLGLVRALARNPLQPGRLAACATLAFAMGRLMLEWLRVDAPQQLLQPASLLAGGLCVCGLGVGVALWRRSTGVREVASAD